MFRCFSKIKKAGGLGLLAGSMGLSLKYQILPAESFPLPDYEERENKLKKQKTEIYVWGNGFVAKDSRTFLNFKPKRLRFFSGELPPQPVSGAFGWYHEAYIDSSGRLYVAPKHKLFASKRKHVDDKARQFSEVVIPSNQKNKPQALPIQQYNPKTTRGQSKVKQVAFSRKRLFVLTTDGKVWSLPIQEYEIQNSTGILNGHDLSYPITEGKLHAEDGKYIAELPKNIKEISAGDSHFLALDNSGSVWAMGDDTFGQCGMNLEFNAKTQEYQNFMTRLPYPPFKSAKIYKPMKIPMDYKIVRIQAGFRHSLAITSNGKLLGWGWNNQQQLSHSDVFGKVLTQQQQKQQPIVMDQEAEDMYPQAFFTPVLINYKLDKRKTVNVAAGDQFSVIHTVHEDTGLHELFSTGNNLRGQLGINRLNHLSDIERIEDISGLKDEKGQPIKITNLACGSKHCMATLDHGAFFTWGDNQAAQRGNRTRVFIESPFPHNKFEYEHNVEKIVCGRDNSAAIVEYLPRRKLSFKQLKEKFKDRQPEDLPDKLAQLKLQRKREEKRRERQKKAKERRFEAGGGGASPKPGQFAKKEGWKEWFWGKLGRGGSSPGGGRKD